MASTSAGVKKTLPMQLFSGSAVIYRGILQCCQGDPLFKSKSTLSILLESSSDCLCSSGYHERLDLKQLDHGVLAPSGL